jgi:hypothetical protein
VYQQIEIVQLVSSVPLTILIYSYIILYSCIFISKSSIIAPSTASQSHRSQDLIHLLFPSRSPPPPPVTRKRYAFATAKAARRGDEAATTSSQMRILRDRW